jgi:hypothetical protein
MTASAVYQQLKLTVDCSSTALCLDSQCSTPLRACITIQIIDPQPLNPVKLSKTSIKGQPSIIGVRGICSIAMQQMSLNIITEGATRNS